MLPTAYAALINAACFIAWLTLMLPAILFLRGAWAARRDDFFCLMTDDVLARYYERFYPSRKIDAAQRQHIFRKEFGHHYGRRWYAPPLLLLGFLSAWGLSGTAGTVKAWVGVAGTGNTFTIPDVALGAFLGGVMWVVSDHLGRFRDRDFTTHDVYNAVFRLLIAVPLGLSLASLSAASLQVPFAFILGVFPTSTLFTIARRVGSKQFGIGDDAVENQGSELEKLQGVGKVIAERFRDEGISSIAGLAWTNPIDLTIRTNLEFSFVVDCISQALLWIYLQDSVVKLYALSLRGAQEVSSFIDDIGSADATVHAEAAKTLTDAATLLGISPEAFHQTLLQVSQDPSTKFLVELWAPEAA